MTGGGGNDTFAFLHTTDGLATITDFNNTTAHDHIAVSASGFGGGLTAGMDVTPIFETSGDNQFSGLGPSSISIPQTRRFTSAPMARRDRRSHWRRCSRGDPPSARRPDRVNRRELGFPGNGAGLTTARAFLCDPSSADPSPAAALPPAEFRGGITPSTKC